MFVLLIFNYIMFLQFFIFGMFDFVYYIVIVGEGLLFEQCGCVILVLGIVVGLVMFDIVIVNMVLFVMVLDFNIILVVLVWIVIVYQLVMMVVLLLLVVLGEIVGYCCIYIWGLVFFIVVLLLCVVVWLLFMLVMVCFLQGLGGVGIMSVNIVLI